MRISGFGFGGSGQGGNKGNTNTFRRRHRVGERVSGRILRRERHGLAWVNFEGVELLAQIETNPEPGSTLLFQIMSLEPEIELKELAVARAMGDPLSPAADTFWAARTRFEAATSSLREELASSTGSPEERKQLFERLVSANEQWAALWHELSTARTNASTILIQRGIGVLEYAPWLLPEALSGELLIVEHTSKSGTATLETAFSFMVPGIGQCELKLLETAPTAGARLYLEHPDNAKAAESLLRARMLAHLDVDFHGTSPLPIASRAGVLAPLLTAGPSAPPRFSRRV